MKHFYNNFTICLNINNQCLPISDMRNMELGWTYNETLIEEDHSQYTLQFELRECRVVDNNVSLYFPLLADVHLGSKLRLLWNETYIDFIITNVTPQTHECNSTYTITAKDEPSVLWSRQHVGYSYITKDQDGLMTVRNIFDVANEVLTDNFLHLEDDETSWSVAQRLTDSNITEEDMLEYRTLAAKYFTLEVNDSNPYNVLIEACNLVNAKMIIDHKHKIIDFRRKDNVQDSGYYYTPERNLLSSNVDYNSDSLCTMLHVSGGVDVNNNTMSMIPFMPLPVQNYILDKYPKWNDKKSLQWDDIEKDLVYTNASGTQTVKATYVSCANLSLVPISFVQAPSELPVCFKEEGLTSTYYYDYNTNKNYMLVNRDEDTLWRFEIKSSDPSNYYTARKPDIDFNSGVETGFDKEKIQPNPYNFNDPAFYRNQTSANMGVVTIRNRTHESTDNYLLDFVFSFKHTNSSGIATAENFYLPAEDKMIQIQGNQIMLRNSKSIVFIQATLNQYPSFYIEQLDKMLSLEITSSKQLLLFLPKSVSQSEFQLNDGTYTYVGPNEIVQCMSSILYNGAYIKNNRQNVLRYLYDSDYYTNGITIIQQMKEQPEDFVLAMGGLNYQAIVSYINKYFKYSNNKSEFQPLDPYYSFIQLHIQETSHEISGNQCNATCTASLRVNNTWINCIEENGKLKQFYINNFFNASNLKDVIQSEEATRQCKISSYKSYVDDINCYISNLDSTTSIELPSTARYSVANDSYSFIHSMKKQDGREVPAMCFCINGVEYFNKSDTEFANPILAPYVILGQELDVLNKTKSDELEKITQSTLEFLTIAKKIPYLGQFLIDLKPVKHLMSTTQEEDLNDILNLLKAYNLELIPKKYELLQLVNQLDSARSALQAKAETYGSIRNTIAEMLLQKNKAQSNAEELNKLEQRIKEQLIELQRCVDDIYGLCVAYQYAQIIKRIGLSTEYQIGQTGDMFFQRLLENGLKQIAEYEKYLQQGNWIIQSSNTTSGSDPRNIYYDTNIRRLQSLCTSTRDMTINLFEKTDFAPGAYELINYILEILRGDQSIDYGQDAEVQDIEKAIKNNVLRILYTKFHQFIYEQAYSNTDEINATALFNQACIHFEEINRPAESFALEVLDIMTLENINHPKLQVGNYISVYNYHSIQALPFLEELNKIKSYVVLLKNCRMQHDWSQAQEVTNKLTEMRSLLVSKYNAQNNTSIKNYSELLNLIYSDRLYITSITRTLREQLKDSVSVEPPSRYKTILSKLIKSI